MKRKKEETEEEKNRFKPELYKWTNTNGVTRNYVQHLLKIAKFDFINKSLGINDINSFLFEALSEVIQRNFKNLL